MIICLEGINGTGKTTQALRLVDSFGFKSSKLSTKAHCFQDPGVCPGSPAGDLRILAKKATWCNPMTRMMLYMAARCELITKVNNLIKDDSDVDIVLDRYVCSYYAYGRSAFEVADTSENWIASIAAVLKACGAFTPDLTIVLTADVDTCFERCRTGSDGSLDVYEREGKAKFERLRNEYDGLLLSPSQYPYAGKRVVTVDTTSLNASDVHVEINQLVCCAKEAEKWDLGTPVKKS